MPATRTTRTAATTSASATASATPSTDAQVEVLVYGHEAVVTPIGDLDISSERLLDKALTALAAAEVHVTVDMAEVTFIDSWAVALLQRAACDVAAGGRSFQLVDASTFVTHTLELLGAEYLLVA